MVRRGFCLLVFAKQKSEPYGEERILPPCFCGTVPRDSKIPEKEDYSFIPRLLFRHKAEFILV